MLWATTVELQLLLENSRFARESVEYRRSESLDIFCADRHLIFNGVDGLAASGIQNLCRREPSLVFKLPGCVLFDLGASPSRVEAGASRG